MIDIDFNTKDLAILKNQKFLLRKKALTEKVIFLFKAMGGNKLNL